MNWLILALAVLVYGLILGCVLPLVMGNLIGRTIRRNERIETGHELRSLASGERKCLLSGVLEVSCAAND